jgi:hypothetical protein
VSTTTDTLILKISEDAYQGNAQYTIDVNGVQVGGTRTATASHSAGQSTVVTLTGNYGADPTVVVTFLNDAWGGAGLDRNLYVDGITYDGVVQTASAPLYSNGAQGFALHSGAKSTIAPKSTLALTDDTGATTTLATITSGTSTATAGTSYRLDGNVFQSVDSQGVANIRTDVFDQGIVALSVKDTGGASYHLSDFAKTTAELAGAAAGSLTVDGAAGGTLQIDSGNYTVSVAASGILNGTAAQNTFNITLGGSGNDSLLIDDSGTYGLSTNVIHAGTGTDRMVFMGAKYNTVYGGTGTDTVTADKGSNTFVAGTGTMTVTGGTGTDLYIYHATGGLLKVTDFSLSGGDTLTVDAALKASLHIASDGTGGTMISFGVAGHGIDLAGISSMTASQIHFA